MTTNALGRRNGFLVKRIKEKDFSHSLTSSTDLETSLDLWFPCWNKCGEKKSGIFQMKLNSTPGTSTFSEVLTSSGKSTKEAGRDSYLSISLEKSTGNQTIEVAEELKINIWSKVKNVNTEISHTHSLIKLKEGLCERDLKKTVIRKPKGW